MNITLYRKYRPQNFNEIAGQKYVTRAIKNSLKEDKLSHAYLFTGPRGVGKTTIARLIAKGVNCLQNGITDNPCGICENCVEITQGISMDMIEIDAASNRGIDEIRELKEKINYQPVKGRKKIYIIDEVHMLTKEAFNALLKTLEEPPAHIIFILATTEIDKIPDTVISRCQRYDFMPIEKENIRELLSEVAKKENITIDSESLDLIYRKSEGSARDSFSIFEQVVSNFNGEEITLVKTQKALGVIPDIILDDFLKLVKKANKNELIDFVDKIWEDGIIIETFLKDFAYYLKERFKKDDSLTTDFILKTISSIFFILNEFKYEEDKRLLGYVLIHELYKEKTTYRQVEENKIKNIKNTNSSINVENNTVNSDKAKNILSEVSINISEVENNWENIKNKLGVIIKALMIDTYPEKIENDTLTIRFPAGHNFHCEKIITSEKQKVEKVIENILGKRLYIEGIVDGDSGKNKENDLINKVLDFFGAEIIEKR